jgi:DNA-binding CsgD family transcriptional regulator
MADRMKTSPYPFDFTDLDREHPSAELLDRMAMDKVISPSSALMLLLSEWPPPRVRLRAVEIIAASLPPRIAGLTANLSLRDLAARRQQTPRQLLQAELLPQGVFLAVQDRFSEGDRWVTARAAAVWLWNHRLRHLDPMVVANARQRHRFIGDAFGGESDLDRRLVDQVVVALAAEVAAIVGRAPELAGRPVDVPRAVGVFVGPAWEVDERGRAHAWTAVPEWTDEAVLDLVRKVYKHVRRSLLGWAFREPRLQAARDAAKVWHGEIPVTAQRRQHARAHGAGPQTPTPAARAEARSLLAALVRAATPRERQVLHLLAAGHSPGEVADLLGCARAVVDTNHNRLRKKFRALQR